MEEPWRDWDITKYHLDVYGPPLAYRMCGSGASAAETFRTRIGYTLRGCLDLNMANNEEVELSGR